MAFTLVHEAGPAGVTIYAVMQRLDTDAFFDPADDTFKAFVSDATHDIPLVEQTNNHGIYTVSITDTNFPGTATDVSVVLRQQAGGAPDFAVDEIVGTAFFEWDGVAPVSQQALKTALVTAQDDLDIITGSDGVFLASTGQPAGFPANLEASAGQIIKATVDTVVNTHTPTTTEFQADDITEATADHYIGRRIIFTSGVLDEQSKEITDYAAVGGIGQFTTEAFTEAPSNNDTFIIV